MQISRSRTTTALAAYAAIALSAAGCCSTGHQKTLTTGGPIHYRATMRLARQPVPGGAVDIAGTSYVYLGKPYFGLRTSTEEVGTTAPAPAGGITTTSVDETTGPGPLTLHVERRCLSGHRFALAYGLLHQPQDTVVAVNPHTRATVHFNRVTIPSQLNYDGGVLVYRLLEGNTTTVITRATDGQVLSNEPYGSVDSAPCTS